LLLLRARRATRWFQSIFKHGYDPDGRQRKREREQWSAVTRHRSESGDTSPQSLRSISCIHPCNPWLKNGAEFGVLTTDKNRRILDTEMSGDQRPEIFGNKPGLRRMLTASPAGGLAQAAQTKLFVQPEVKHTQVAQKARSVMKRYLRNFPEMISRRRRLGFAPPAKILE
jgi:hypothetical protein